MGLLEEQLDLRTEQHKSRQRIKAAPPAQRQIIEQQEAQRLGELAKTLNPGAYDSWMRQQLSDPMPQEPMQSSAQGAGVVQPKYRNPSIQNYNVSRAPGVSDVHLGKSSVAAAPVVNPGAPANSFPLTREHVQPMMNPGNPQGVARRSGLPPYEKPGLLAQAGDALGKFGSSLSKGAGNLFNDPNRMALLQGGLSMMDPNSYYDQQGFGSVFTGLNRGLGAAQQGMQGVYDRKKSLADRKLTEAKIAGEGVNGQKFKSAQIGDATYVYSDADIIRRRNEIMVSEKKGWQAATNQAIAEVGTKIDKGISPNKKSDIRFEYEQGNTRLNDIDEAISYAEDAFNTGFVGMGKRGYDKGRGFFSIDGEPTESTKLVNALNHITSQNWKELVGSGQLSKSDQDFLEKVIHTPDNIFTTASEIRRSLRRLRKIQEKAQMGRAKELGIPYGQAKKGPAKTLKNGGTVDAWLESFETKL